MRISDLPRNDVPAAIRFLRARLDAGDFTSDDGQSLFTLQDDADELAAAVKALIAERKRAGLPIGPFGAEA